MVSRLELHYLTNRDANLHLYSWWTLPMRKRRYLPGFELNEAARTGIESLTAPTQPRRKYI